jgi:hypothetical protein
MGMPLVNGRSYDFTSITVSILGVPLVGISAISYTEEQTKENNFGTGNRPVSRGRGAINASGSIDIHMEDVEKIRQAAPNRSLLQLPAFDIVVVFGNPTNPRVHILKNAEFTSDGVEASQGDTAFVRSFDLVLSHVEYKS